MKWLGRGYTADPSRLPRVHFQDFVERDMEHKRIRCCRFTDTVSSKRDDRTNDRETFALKWLLDEQKMCFLHDELKNAGMDPSELRVVYRWCTTRIG